MKWGYISAQKLKTEPSKSFAVCNLTANQWPSGVSLESQEVENIPQVPREIEPKFA